MGIRMKKIKFKLRVRSTCLTLLALVLTATFVAPSFAFQFGSGDLTGSFDSTLSYGLAWRMADQDSDLIGVANGGNAYSLNFDDGDLNYDKGDLINNTAKITSELGLQYKSFGLFVRGSAFYDFENNDGDRARTDLSDETLDMVGKDAELLDAYITWDFDVAQMPAQIRVGSQVLSWGESTFIQNGINVINPFDVSKLRVAGAELKEGLIPVGMVSASISPTENITFEGFYQYDWQEVKIDPPGSYWSTNDFAGEGGDQVMLGFGQWSDQGESWTGALYEDSDERFNMVPRGSNVYADDDGQYGVAMRVYAANLNDTEFGFYYMNYHSRLPVLSARTGSAVGALKATTAATAAGTFAALYDPQDPTSATAAITAGVTAGTTTGVTGGLDVAEAQAIATGAINAATAGGSALASAYAVNEYAQTAEYMIEYPEDIQLFGVSFNTTLPASGIALQGEVSHRLDVPLQMDDIELIFAALGPISPGLATYNQIYDATGQYEYYIQGYKRLDVTQAQITATKLLGPTFGADQFVLVGEVGLTHVHGMPDKDDLRMDGVGTPISGNALLASSHYDETESSSAFADATSWGYRLVAKLDFNNAIGAVTLSPRVAWAHDVNGTTPGPGGNFIDGRKTVTLGLEANYQNQWTADLSYTDFFGAGRYNLINDRDFLAFNIKYSF
ncbi:Protein of unknown function [Desulfuromusa kysingii]|uniref:DUF1302 domain-containing protein n=1 Tax=Desulfuromusa kysingii TaxID=37625 RepID=A0A1H4DEN2_9BACT|nr:DUF1302 domain-containing protein [Desulfuromusa kysingii]SEA70956.1 Protein of unknown function [Desulfuromusa kysingii]